MVYDLIVIGNGSVGAAAGFYTTQAGLNVLMVDAAFPPHQGGSHDGDTRFIRHAYGKGEKYVPLVQRTQTLCQTLSDDGATLIFHRSGVINLGPRQSLFIQNAASGVQRYRLPCELMTGATVNARWPVMRVPEDYIGVFEHQAGYLKSELAIARYISLAEKAGYAQLFNCGVTGINLAGGDAEVETREGSRYQGRKLLVAAGPWVQQLLPSLPVTPVRKVFSGIRRMDDSVKIIISRPSPSPPPTAAIIMVSRRWRMP